MKHQRQELEENIQRDRAEVVSKAIRPQFCVWQQDKDDGSWDTDCGNKFCIESGTPGDNRMLFCCYCGAALVTPNVLGNRLAAGGAAKEGETE